MSPFKTRTAGHAPWLQHLAAIHYRTSRLICSAPRWCRCTAALYADHQPPDRIVLARTICRTWAGDFLVQNANSAVGCYLIQLAKQRGFERSMWFAEKKCGSRLTRHWCRSCSYRWPRTHRSDYKGRRRQANLSGHRRSGRREFHQAHQGIVFSRHHCATGCCP